MRALILAVLVAALAAGCGQKGPLVLPDAKATKSEKKKSPPPVPDTSAPPVTPP